MKNLLFFSLLFIVTYVHAQSPQSFKYQAVLRDNNGLPLIEKNITIKISILQGSLTGLTAYSEVHQAKTSPVGVVNLEIGKGTQNSGNFSTISWGTNTHFVKIEIDPLGGSNFEQVGTSQLLSVPYALYAEKSGDEKWGKTNSDISYLGGNVGIGMSNPLYKLQVNGAISATQFLQNGVPILPQWTSNGNNISYTSGKVGIGTNNPLAKFEIDGGGDLNLFDLRNNSNSLGINAYVSSDTDFHGSALIGRRSRGTNVLPQSVFFNDRITGFYGSIFMDGAYQNSSAIQMYVGANAGPGSYSSNIRFETTSANESLREERLRISETGNILVKTGDVLMESIGTGVIMKSPNGNCWRMTISDSGSPIFSSVTCPQ
jgi:hypothetical protein